MFVRSYEVSPCKKALVLFTVMFASNLAFAGIHDACHTDNKESKTFAVAYAGAIIDLKADETTPDGKRVYEMPALDYEQAFREVCKVVDAHSELWNQPSRDAVTFAVDALWKRKAD
jgi:hypothetical protein